MDKKKVLIIDDDMTFLESIELVLISRQFDIVKASTGEFLFEILTIEKPDLILLDINLPNKNGFELLESIRANSEFKRLPVIMITGDVTTHIDKAFSEGADDCIFKPVDIDELINRMNKLLVK
ncbi:MAG: response regulator [Endomicrobium sp.]|jgi:DNA-binding response OmpR family regulator|nr:response regulator [Endomicrobium sp.]